VSFDYLFVVVLRPGEAWDCEVRRLSMRRSSIKSGKGRRGLESRRDGMSEVSLEEREGSWE